MPKQEKRLIPGPSLILLMCILFSSLSASLYTESAVAQEYASQPSASSPAVEWGSLRIGVPPPKESVELQQYDMAVARFKSYMRQDFLPFMERDRSLLAQDPRVLREYVALRDEWIQSDDFGTYVLAGFITRAIGEVLVGVLEECFRKQQQIPAAFVDVLHKNRVSLDKVLPGFEGILTKEEFKYTPLTIHCSDTPRYKVHCWEEYVSQFGLFYYNLEDGGRDRYVLSARLTSSERHSAGVFLRHYVQWPSIVLRVREPAFLLLYWSHLLDENFLVSLHVEAFQEMRLPYDGVSFSAHIDHRFEQSVAGNLAGLATSIANSKSGGGIPDAISIRDEESIVGLEFGKFEDIRASKEVLGELREIAENYQIHGRRLKN